MHSLPAFRTVVLCAALMVMSCHCLPAAPPTPAAASPATTVGAEIDPRSRVAFPETPAVVDVTRAPYFARGDGQTDDTEALQRAVNDTVGLRKILYLPAGVYLVSKTIRWPNKNSSGSAAWGFTTLQGESASKTTIRLKDGVFSDPKQVESIMWCGGFGSADWFHNYVQDLTFDVGRGNPGAIALQFYSNNSGAVRNCRFVAAEGSGDIGLDLGHRDMNGPLLVQHCEVAGFRRGIVCQRAVNGHVFEHVTLRGQREVGFENGGQSVSLRSILSENRVPAFKVYGTLCLVDATLTGEDGASLLPALINYNGGRIFLRDVRTSGYSRAVADVSTPDSGAALRISGEDKPGSRGPNVSEYHSHPATRPFTMGSSSLRLPVEEPPQPPIDPPASWADVNHFGADPTGQKDSAEAIQRAVDSGATTVFFPGSYALKSTVVIRGKVRRLLGVGGSIDYTRQVKPDFRVEDGESPLVTVEHFASIHGGLEIDTKRTLVFRSVSDCDLAMTAKAEGGELFMEDFVTHDLRVRKQRVWARQLNVENQGTHVLNAAGDLWVLGYKTERGGTLLRTRDGGRSEILGGLSYTTTAGKLAPMFVNEGSSVFAFFHEVCFNGDPFAVLVSETRSGETRVVRRGEGATTPYVGH